MTDTPETKEHTFLCRVLLKEQRDSTAIHSIDDCKAILYLQRDSAAAGLKRGDELWVSARISPPVNRLCPLSDAEGNQWNRICRVRKMDAGIFRNVIFR